MLPQYIYTISTTCAILPPGSLLPFRLFPFCLLWTKKWSFAYSQKSISNSSMYCFEYKCAITYNNNTIFLLDIVNMISLSSPCQSSAIKKSLPNAVDVHSPPRWTSALTQILLKVNCYGFSRGRTWDEREFAAIFPLSGWIAIACISSWLTASVGWIVSCALAQIELTIFTTSASTMHSTKLCWKL